MTTRICRTEKFIPASGNPVYQIQEELSINGMLQLLPPRIPTAEELEGAEDDFAAVQQARIVELEAQVATLEAKVKELAESLPWNPRIMEAKAFVARITASEMLTLAGSQDATVQSILGMLMQWVANDWPIILDSPEMQQAVGYLGQAGMVTQDRVAELLRDCTKDEAHVADGE